MPVVERHVGFVFCLGGGELLVPLRRACHCSAHMLSFFLGVFRFCGNRGFLDGSGGFNASEFSSTSMFVTYMFVADNCVGRR